MTTKAAWVYILKLKRNDVFDVYDFINYINRIFHFTSWGRFYDFNHCVKDCALLGVCYVAVTKAMKHLSHFFVLSRDYHIFSSFRVKMNDVSWSVHLQVGKWHRKRTRLPWANNKWNKIPLGYSSYNYLSMVIMGIRRIYSQYFAIS